MGNIHFELTKRCLFVILGKSLINSVHFWERLLYSYCTDWGLHLMCSKILYCFIESSKTVFWLRSYWGRFSWVKFTAERRMLCVPWTPARNQLCLPLLPVQVPSPGRAAHLPHIPRPYKHNVFKFCLCLCVWLLFSNGNDRAPSLQLPALAVDFSFFKAVVIKREMNLIPVAAEADELWRGRGTLQPLQTVQCWARSPGVWQTAHGNAADTCGDLCFFRSITLCPRKEMCCPAQVFKDNKVLTISPQGILYFYQTPKHGHWPFLMYWKMNLNLNYSLDIKLSHCVTVTT